jgi:pilus assembly protein CpaB
MITLLRQLLLTLSRIPPALILIGIGGLAFLVSYAVQTQLAQIDSASRAKIKDIEDRENQRTRVVYATKDVAEGDRISVDVVEERETQIGRVPEDALTSSSVVVGKVAKYGIAAGQIISQHDVATRLESAFERQLKPGERAVTFGVDNNSGVAGFVSPDSRVDIFAMVGTGGDTKASAVLSDVQVVAVGQTFRKPPGNAPPIPTSNITVSVTPDEAQKLMKAISASKLYVALRNPTDHSPVATVDVTALFKKPAPNFDLASAPPIPPGVLPPIQPPDDLSEQKESARAPKGHHQIELWSGNRKDLLIFGGG